MPVQACVMDAASLPFGTCYLFAASVGGIAHCIVVSVLAHDVAAIADVTVAAMTGKS